MLQEAGLHDSNSTRAPCGKRLPAAPRDNSVDAALFRRIVGKLQWLSITARPDITFSVHRLSTKVSMATKVDMLCAKRVLRYLNGTRGTGLRISGGGELVAYVDSDWATCEWTRRSVTGYVIGFLHTPSNIAEPSFSPIVWRSQKQTCVAQSTCEAEYIACAVVCREVSYIRGLLLELGWIGTEATRVFCDNEAAVLMANGSGRSKFARYIDIKFHFARWCASEGRVTFVNVRTQHNLADLFTKALSASRHTVLAARVIGEQ